MRTTVDLPDDLFIAAKKRAAELPGWTWLIGPRCTIGSNTAASLANAPNSIAACCALPVPLLIVSLDLAERRQADGGDAGGNGRRAG